MTVRLAVFASGSGTNLQALIDHVAGMESPPYRVVLAVSDREGAGALDRARRAGIEDRIVPVAGREPEEVADETLAALHGAGVEIVALAGYLRLIPGKVIRGYPERILNIHPALLPAFGGKGMYGLRVHEAVLASGARLSGPTVHLVNEAYDEGTIVAQWPVPVRPGDTPESLAERVLEVEHLLYPATVEALARAVAAEEPFEGLGLPAARFVPGPDATPAEVAAEIRAAFGLP